MKKITIMFNKSRIYTKKFLINKALITIKDYIPAVMIGFAVGLIILTATTLLYWLLTNNFSILNMRFSNNKKAT